MWDKHLHPLLSRFPRLWGDTSSLTQFFSNGGSLILGDRDKQDLVDVHYL